MEKADVDELEVDKVERLMRSLGEAWGPSGLDGSPRIILIVAGDDYGWRVASTESPADTTDILRAVSGKELADAREVTSRFTPKGSRR